MPGRERSAEAEAEAIINSSDESVEGLLEDNERYVDDAELLGDEEMKDLVDTFEDDDASGNFDDFDMGHSGDDI